MVEMINDNPLNIRQTGGGMSNNGHKFKRVLWAGKNTEDGSIVFNWMYNLRREAVETFKHEPEYEIVKVELKEL